MQSTFHVNNRNTLYDTLPDGTIFIVFAGQAPRHSADAFYSFFTNRNFVYLTGLMGIETEGFIFMATKENGKVDEVVYALPSDLMAERWNGKRFTFAEIKDMSGVESVRPLLGFEGTFHRLAASGRFTTLALDLERFRADEPDSHAHRIAKQAAARYPGLAVIDRNRQLRIQRTIKAPCEIEGMKKATEATREAVLAMMKATRPGAYEYNLKAAFDHALTSRGLLFPGFPPIIATGENNFCIHYYGYRGQIADGDMILIDSGATVDGMCNDVSRTWPANGRFNERQRALYSIAYETSEYVFSIIKPGMPMRDVDGTVKVHAFEGLKKLGLVDEIEQVGKIIWHGGAHHIGYDVHDAVEVVDGIIKAGMMFCVDVGIYCEEWGIGFRLEDNCLVTEDGCINLSASIPRSIEDIEAVFLENSK